MPNPSGLTVYGSSVAAAGSPAAWVSNAEAPGAIRGEDFDTMKTSSG